MTVFRERISYQRQEHLLMSLVLLFLVQCVLITILYKTRHTIKQFTSIKLSFILLRDL